MADQTPMPASERMRQIVTTGTKAYYIYPKYSGQGEAVLVCAACSGVYGRRVRLTEDDLNQIARDCGLTTCARCGQEIR
jgi:uncharacterized protein (UPF0212 family)